MVCRNRFLNAEHECSSIVVVVDAGAASADDADGTASTRRFSSVIFGQQRSKASTCTCQHRAIARTHRKKVL